MSPSTFTCSIGDSLEHALRLMGDHQVRRLPVVDAAGKLLGILSINDLIRIIVTQNDPRSRTSLSSTLVEALASICEPRSTSDDRIDVVPPAMPSAATRGTARV